MAMSLSLGLGLTSIPVLQRGEATDYATTWNFFRGDAEFAKTPWAALTRSGAGTRINASGLIESTTSPRIDYDPVTLAARGLLGEGQAAEEINSHSLASPQMVTQTITVTAAQRTLSFYGTGTVTLSGAHSATVVGTGAYPSRKTYTFTPSAGSLTLTVSGTVQYPQLILGAVAQSYIPNPGTGTALRAADGWYLSGAAFTAAWAGVVAAGAGTIVVEFEGVAGLNDAVSIVSLSVPSGNGYVLYKNVGGGNYYSYDGTTLATFGVIPVGQIIKAAISFNGAEISLTANGATPTSAPHVGNWLAANGIMFNQLTPGGAYQFVTRIKSCRIIPGYITGAALQALTA